jgi:ribonucleoside-diphosphate reductase alpha chain
VMEMLDNVIQRFIDTAPPQLHRSVLSAIEERSVGLGVMGFHSYLQKKMVAFDTEEALQVNREIFKTFHAHVDAANKSLGASRGEPKMLTGTGYRFAHTSALAPTASNAVICGNVSPSAEPWRANAYRQDTMSGTFIQKNKHLDTLVKQKDADGLCDYDATMLQIIHAEGSIQNIDCFSEHEKNVFKTASEIDQMWAVEHVAQRQPYIDQGQSFNIFIRPDISIKQLHDIHFQSWKKGIKAMYYVRSEKLANTDTVGKKIERVKLDEPQQTIINEEECLACQA